MKKIGIVCLALVLALGMMGIGYAAWTQRLIFNVDITSAVPPSVSTVAPTRVGAHTATLNGELTRFGTASVAVLSFDYGDINYNRGEIGANPSSWNGALPKTFSAAISGLAPGTTYHFKANGHGLFKASGDDITFTTAADLNITTNTLAQGTVGPTYSQTLSATGGLAPYTWSNTPNLPPGLTLNSATGVITGTPTTAGTTLVRFRVMDNSTAPVDVAEKELSFTISNLEK